MKNPYNKHIISDIYLNISVLQSGPVHANFLLKFGPSDPGAPGAGSPGSDGRRKVTESGEVSWGGDGKG